MSNILRNKQGNLSKVKYFLPAYRQEDSHTKEDTQKQSKKEKTVTKKQSANTTHQNRSVSSNADISFEIVGIHESSFKENIQNSNLGSKVNIEKGLESMRKQKNGEKAIEASLSTIRALANSREWTLPEGDEKEEFYRFIQTLKDDETYQHTVTMFTIMYFYEQRRKKTSHR